MSATMARQGGQVQLEQSNLRLAFNMAKMAKGGFSQAAIEETQQLIKNPLAEVWEAKEQGVLFPGHNKVEAAIQRHLAMVCGNQKAGSLPSQHGTVMNSKTHWRRTGMGAPPPQPVPCPLRMPPAPPGDSERSRSSETDGVPPGYMYIHTPPPTVWFFNLDPYGKDRKCNKDFIPDLLTDEGPSTG